VSILSVPIAPLNPSGDALVALERLLLDLDYNGVCRSGCKTVVRQTGCVADCVPEYLDAEHEAVCEAAYVDALPVVGWDDPAWGHVPESIVPPELEDDDEPDDSWRPWWDREQHRTEAAASEAERKRSRYLST
jgi:hypothetical protein